MLSIKLEVDDQQFVRVLAEVEHGLDKLIGRVADDLADEAATEAGHVSRRLAAPWKIEGALPTERHVEAPEWWAHFLAGGTQEHGPTSASQLVFDVNGQTVFAKRVRGIPADHFDERAIEKTRGHLDEIIRRVIEEATL